MAERLARLALGQHSTVEVASAGTHAEEGWPMHPPAAAVLTELGADPTGFASRPITPGLLAAADLVLTANRAQRSICAATAPGRLHRTFTLLQFGRLAAALMPDEGLADLPRARARARSEERAPQPASGSWRIRARVAGVPSEVDDLADPVAGTLDDVRACAALIQAALAPALAVIARP
jgi:protein-tyrosine phosphatase